MQVLRTKEFEHWLSKQTAKIQTLVEARLFRVEYFEHIGDYKVLGEGLLELRWKNGLRIYFARVDLKTILLLIGGGKNDQKKDIKKARSLLKQYTSTSA